MAGEPTRDNIAPVQWSGWLKKRGEADNRGWKLRFMILRNRNVEYWAAPMIPSLTSRSSLQTKRLPTDEASLRRLNFSKKGSIPLQAVFHVDTEVSLRDDGRVSTLDGPAEGRSTSIEVPTDSMRFNLLTASRDYELAAIDEPARASAIEAMLPLINENASATIERCSVTAKCAAPKGAGAMNDEERVRFTVIIHTDQHKEFRGFFTLKLLETIHAAMMTSGATSLQIPRSPTDIIEQNAKDNSKQIEDLNQYLSYALTTTPLKPRTKRKLLALCLDVDSIAQSVSYSEDFLSSSRIGGGAAAGNNTGGRQSLTAAAEDAFIKDRPWFKRTPSGKTRVVHHAKNEDVAAAAPAPAPTSEFAPVSPNTAELRERLKEVCGEFALLSSRVLEEALLEELEVARRLNTSP